jgi:hypothetical protein
VKVTPQHPRALYIASADEPKVDKKSAQYSAWQHNEVVCGFLRELGYKTDADKKFIGLFPESTDEVRFAEPVTDASIMRDLTGTFKTAGKPLFPFAGTADVRCYWYLPMCGVDSVLFPRVHSTRTSLQAMFKWVLKCIEARRADEVESMPADIEPPTWAKKSKKKSAGKRLRGSDEAKEEGEEHED